MPSSSAPTPAALRDTTAWPPEADCLPPLIEAATLTKDQAEHAQAIALQLVTQWRSQGAKTAMEAVLGTFSLASPEGQTLLGLAEALPRIPDAPTRDALIRNRIGTSEWHQPNKRPLLGRAAALGLTLGGRMGTGGLSSLFSLARRGGTPVLRRTLDVALRAFGQEFILGETISQALKATRPHEAQGFTYAFDMLGEPAMTAADAARNHRDILHTLDQISRHPTGNTLLQRPILSLKLSALHPRYERAQRTRIMAELLPLLRDIAIRACAGNIPITIDAEESSRLPLSLDLLDALCQTPALDGWNGIGFTLQAYRKDAITLVDTLAAIATRTNRRLMLRLTKGAYWEYEIKHAQTEGLDDFPVFTRQCHTDVSFIACARKMLSLPDRLYPQFATHNTYTIGSILALDNSEYDRERYEFQCLHGMGESLFQPIVSASGHGHACRIYAPVGPQRTLLPYLVRRLLENAARVSFVHQARNIALPLTDLLADPVTQAQALTPPYTPNPAIKPPQSLYAPSRRNAAGFDLTDEYTLQDLTARIDLTATHHAAPILANAPETLTPSGQPRTIHNPADLSDHVGIVHTSTGADIEHALQQAHQNHTRWTSLGPIERATTLENCANALEHHHATLFGILMREAGRTLANTVSELREAVDYLRFYAADIRKTFTPNTHAPLGTVACITPWSFPLEIFVCQIAAALAAGNVVIAKPAEETPLIAATIVRLFHTAGLPTVALQLLPGDGDIGAALVADPRIDGVSFTGSTPTAKTIARTLRDRCGKDGRPIPLIAETGGQNAMIVDSSAQPEQVVADILTSAFDSAGQRCSALRILCIQDDCAEPILTMLRGAIHELTIGNPAYIETDLGPLISAEAKARIQDHIDYLRRAGRTIWQPDAHTSKTQGHYLPPTLIDIGRVADIGSEVFGPVLHIRRFARTELDGVIDAINATGFGLTFGIHSRIASTVDHVTKRIIAGNIYVNRNTIGAVVGTQPFGGTGLSGTGPKAGGPLSLHRLLARCPTYIPPTPGRSPALARALVAFLESRDPVAARRTRQDTAHTLVGASQSLPGPFGETNTYTLVPRGPVLCAGESWPALLRAVGMALGTGNTVLVLGPDHAVEWMARMPQNLKSAIQRIDAGALPECSTMLMQADSPLAQQAAITLTAREGRLIPIHHIDSVRPEDLLEERVLTINTAAAGHAPLTSHA